MDNQTKINILSLAIDRITEYSNGNIPDTVLIKNLNIIKQELEQSNNKDNITTSCKSEEGITIGLIDSLIFISRVLKSRDLKSKEILEALKDLSNDNDLKYLLHSTKDNIDNWSNRELFDYCVDNQLIDTPNFESWDNNFCRGLLINFINTNKSQS